MWHHRQEHGASYTHMHAFKCMPPPLAHVHSHTPCMLCVTRTITQVLRQFNVKRGIAGGGGCAMGSAQGRASFGWKAASGGVLHVDAVARAKASKALASQLQRLSAFNLIVFCGRVFEVVPCLVVAIANRCARAAHSLSSRTCSPSPSPSHSGRSGSAAPACCARGCKAAGAWGSVSAPLEHHAYGTRCVSQCLCEQWGCGSSTHFTLEYSCVCASDYPAVCG
jgi:hypothetical protein